MTAAVRCRFEGAEMIDPEGTHHEPPDTQLLPRTENRLGPRTPPTFCHEQRIDEGPGPERTRSPGHPPHKLPISPPHRPSCQRRIADGFLLSPFSHKPLKPTTCGIQDTLLTRYAELTRRKRFPPPLSSSAGRVKPSRPTGFPTSSPSQKTSEENPRRPAKAGRGSFFAPNHPGLAAALMSPRSCLMRRKRPVPAL